MPTMPRAREAALIVRELEDETFDTDRAHCLNQTAALVWKHCDGTSSVTQICEVLSETMETAIDEKVVWYALEQFNNDRLLEEEIESPAAFKIAGMSRRQMVRTLGLAAMVAIPNGRDCVKTRITVSFLFVLFRGSPVTLREKRSTKSHEITPTNSQGKLEF